MYDFLMKKYPTIPDKYAKGCKWDIGRSIPMKM